MNTGSVASLSSSTAQKQKVTQSPEILGKDDFLKILVAQLSNQDPMKPMQDTEFIGQMAQFSSLEQITNMNSSMNKFFDRQLQSSMTDHAHLIGKSVEWSENNEVASGNVQAVVYKEGKVLAELDNGKQIDISLLERIETEK
ncbi:flagellar hook assembly protein FlgD [Pseudalkalibacillus hwajinpoensis]|uniref:Flagellar hook assembly protein FlgD n=1 Tax=Guptibacillus hwajinpoensis TaxID=208199 RepID=A0A4U1MJH1_9BACL|nr:flagellar hook assembly protein FlgD [Pseudalkalibacillus hwajinpoensis]TKD70550.1 flagellar hook assembly protein FlgD [Pseudalkalibacillus hwajinpoensis]